MKTLILALFMVLTVTLSPIATAATHMGAESPDLHVTLVNNYTTIPSFCGPVSDIQGQNFFRVTSSGTMSTSPFVIPKGWNLIVTDVAWQADPDKNLNPRAGNVLKLDIALMGPSSFAMGEGYTIFTSNLTLGTDFAFGRPAHNEHLTTGFVVGSGIDICPEIRLMQPNGGYNAYLYRVILNGYLSPVPKPSRHN